MLDMLGLSLEERLRKHGRQAAGTLLHIQRGKSVSWGVKGGAEGVSPGQSEVVGTVPKDHCRIRVEPAGEPAFEVDLKVSDDHFFGLTILYDGAPVVVWYDPDDHSKAVMDIDATKHALKHAPPKAGPLTPRMEFPPPSSASSAAAGIADELRKLAALRAQGVLSDAEFDEAKAKLLEGFKP
jgi:hypothetical protein